MKISKARDITDYYKDEKVAKKYIEKRFTEPLNVVEHKRQVEIVNDFIRSKRIKKILEFAPGPARVTAEINAEGGLSIDSSLSMIKVAEKRMNEIGKKWRFRKEDIFNLKLNEKFEMIFSFRFFLHFKKEKREELYKQALKVLDDGGYLVFEAMNLKIVKPVRKLLGKKKYFVYDKLYKKKELIKELEENGFRVVKWCPVLKHFWMQAVFSRPFKVIGLKKIAEKVVRLFEMIGSRNPYEWVVICRKK